MITNGLTADRIVTFWGATGAHLRRFAAPGSRESVAHGQRGKGRPRPMPGAPGTTVEWGGVLRGARNLPPHIESAGTAHAPADAPSTLPPTVGSGVKSADSGSWRPENPIIQPFRGVKSFWRPRKTVSLQELIYSASPSSGNRRSGNDSVLPGAVTSITSPSLSLSRTTWVPLL